MPQSLCLTTATARERAGIADRHVERERTGRAEQRQVALAR